jgi:hypothetical protein
VLHFVQRAAQLARCLDARPGCRRVGAQRLGLSRARLAVAAIERRERELQGRGRDHRAGPVAQP